MASTMFGMTGQQNNRFNIQKFQNDLNNLKATGMNPEQMIQQMMGHQNGS